MLDDWFGRRPTRVAERRSKVSSGGLLDTDQPSASDLLREPFQP
jgi:hypothetical protein